MARSQISLPSWEIPRVVGRMVVLTALACQRRIPLESFPALPLTAATTPSGAPEARSTQTSDRGFVGVVVAGDAVEIESKVEGRVQEIFVKPGDEVRRGAPLARLDIQASTFELRIARAGLKDASGRLRRRLGLAKASPNAVTTEEIDANRREVFQNRARVAKLSESVAEATVRAPFDGTIVEAYLSVGALATPARALLRLVSRAAPRVRFAIPEESIAQVGIGQLVQVKMPGEPKPRVGRVTGLSPEIDAASRMVYAAAALDDAPEVGTLSTGVMARVFLPPRPTP